MTHVTVIGKYAANRALLIKFVTGSFVPVNYPYLRAALLCKCRVETRDIR